MIHFIRDIHFWKKQKIFGSKLKLNEKKNFFISEKNIEKEEEKGKRRLKCENKNMQFDFEYFFLQFSSPNRLILVQHTIHFSPKKSIKKET